MLDIDFTDPDPDPDLGPVRAEAEAAEVFGGSNVTVAKEWLLCT